MLTWHYQRKAPDGCDLYRIAIPKIPAMRFHQSLTEEQAWYGNPAYGVLRYILVLAACGRHALSGYS